MVKQEKGEKEEDNGLVQYVEEEFDRIQVFIDGVTRGEVVSQEIWEQKLGFSPVKDVRINRLKK